LVFTPHIAKRDLWRVSGHEENYADVMFAPTELEETEFRLKPMNCPFHIGSTNRISIRIVICHFAMPSWEPVTGQNYLELCMV
jgi:Threonyl-tRNA synthetase